MPTLPAIIDSTSGRIARPPQRRSGSALPCGSARFWQPAAPPGAGLVCAEVTLDRTQTHVHEGFLIAVARAPIVVGDGTEREIQVTPGTIHVVAPHVPVLLHRAGPRPAAMGLLLITPARPGERRGPSLATSGPVAHASVHDPALHAAATTLLGDLRQPRPDASLTARLIALANSALSAAQLERNAVLRSHRVHRGVLRTRALLQQDPARSVSLEELADTAALSKYHLLRAFQRAHGLTPHGYQMQLRLAQARRLIEAGRPLSFVAYEAGFADQSHLTRRFRDYFGLTPAVYARQLRRPPAADETPLAAALVRSAA